MVSKVRSLVEGLRSKEEKDFEIIVEAAIRNLEAMQFEGQGGRSFQGKSISLSESTGNFDLQIKAY